MTDPLGNVLDRLRGVEKKSSTSYMALCPAHEDRNPSLSVTVRPDGKVRLKCFAGCDNTQVLEIIGVEPKDLYPDELSRKREEKKSSYKKMQWPIKDTEGNVIALHRRIDLPEGKRVWWTDKDGNKGMVRKPAEMPLYGSERLSKDPDGVVVLAEGEKATDALLAAGYLAVGTVTGTSVDPSEEVLSCLKGRSVILWPDNDEVGRSHMRRIGNVLSEIAEDVRVYRWADAPPKGDAADHPDLRSIGGLLEEAPIYIPHLDKDPRIPSNLGSYKAQGIALIERRVTGEGVTGIRTGLKKIDEGLGGLNNGQSYVVAAQTYGGKSLLAGEIGLVAAMEEKKRTLIVSLEQAPVLYGDRFVHYLTGIEHKKSRDGNLTRKEQGELKEAWAYLDELPLVIAAGEFKVQEIRQMAEDLGTELLIVDYLQAVMPDDPRIPRWEQVSHISRGFRGIKTELDIPLVLTAQISSEPLSKGKRPRIWNIANAFDISRDSDAIMILHNEERAGVKDATPGLVKVFCDKFREGEPWATTIQFAKGLPWLEDLPDQNTPREEPEEDDEQDSFEAV